MPCGHKKGPGATDLLPNTQAIRLATKIEPISRPRVRSGQQTKQNGKRYAVGHQQQSRARSSVFLGFGYRRPHISRRQKSQSPTLDAVRVDFSDRFLRSSFERYLVYFRPRGRPFYITRAPSRSAVGDNVRKGA